MDYSQILEVRALENKEDTELKIVAKVNDYSLSKELYDLKGNKFREQICKDAWQRAIEKAKDLKVYFNHQPEINIAKEVTLRAEDDGVYAEITLIENARGLYEKILEGLTTGMSFGFKAIQDKFIDVGTYLQRKIEDFNLFEISVLDKEPAYFGTEVSARSLEVPSNTGLIELELLKLKLDLLKI
ncbi:hypothetical protein HH195_12165 (plasmid) [Sarcina sp. JB2]|uniref:Uncharacterized protein n=1 Tax=Candidatus Sarcina troglodytae TaxID=2726954 RepID=A0ACD1BH53_9CLOT|nr:HK97 family phage prohead protease [Sarcina sp. JB2]QPJ86720.1 hypothetical protein HH195_12165 [Sarcina sp. JB2]